MKATYPRVRFAPSPTGELHVGNARTALFNWLFARRHQGMLVLRIEDTDQARTSEAFEEHLLNDLIWLGIEWDEGPGKEGPCGPYRQSERLVFYRDILQKLVEKDAVYPCFCTDEELEAERQSLIARKMMPRYMGRCRQLSLQERTKLEDEGRRPAWRFKVPPGLIAFKDMIRGPVQFAGSAIGDFIVVRASGIPAYNFACVIDDHYMKISHVIRGEDHLSNTALQILLNQAMGFTPPQFAHHALILGKDRAKLSKRHGAVAVREFRDRGILPEAMFNYLALLGASLGEGREVCTAEEMISRFSLDRAGKSGAIFDEDKLKWLNALYLHHTDTASLVHRLRPFIRSAGNHGVIPDDRRLSAIVEAVRDNLMTLADIDGYAAMFDDDRYVLSEEAASLLKTEAAREVLQAASDVLEGIQGDPAYDQIVSAVKMKTAARGKGLFMPIRAALTGHVRGPELDRIFAVLGKESVKKRLTMVLGGNFPS